MADIPLFNFQEYISQYSGRPQLLRILHMVKQNLLDEDDNLEALGFLFDRLKWDRWDIRTDTNFLNLVSTEINGRLGPLYCVDAGMLQTMVTDYNETLDDRSRALRKTTLYAKEEKENAKNENREENPKKQEDKELAAYVLGEFEYKGGRIREAYDALCQIPNTILLMVVALENQYFEDLSSRIVQRVIPTPGSHHNQMQKDFELICIRGLAHLGRGYDIDTDHYHSAACLFAHLIKFYGRWSNNTCELLSWEDIHMYCTWCGMATMEREELKEIAQDLEQPFTLFIRSYVDGKFKFCLDILERLLKHKAILDMHLFEHVNRLSNLIRDRFTKELVSCHSRVRVKELQETLGIKDMETHLEKMLYNNSLEDYQLVFDGASEENWLMKGEYAALEEEKMNRIIFSKDEMNRAETLEGYEPKPYVGVFTVVDEDNEMKISWKTTMVLKQ